MYLFEAERRLLGRCVGLYYVGLRCPLHQQGNRNRDFIFGRRLSESEFQSDVLHVVFVLVLLGVIDSLA